MTWCMWAIFIRPPKDLAPGWNRLSEVPSSASLHSLLVDGETPTSGKVKEVVVNIFTMDLRSVNYFRYGSAIQKKLHYLMRRFGEKDAGN